MRAQLKVKRKILTNSLLEVSLVKVNI